MPRRFLCGLGSNLDGPQWHIIFSTRFLAGNPGLYPRCPPRGPKIKMVKKWSGNGFGPSQMTCPKSCQKRVPARSGTIKTKKWLGPLRNREPKVGAAAEGRRAHFWVLGGGRRPPPLFVKSPSQIGVFMVSDFAGTLF